MTHQTYGVMFRQNGSWSTVAKCLTLEAAQTMARSQAAVEEGSARVYLCGPADVDSTADYWEARREARRTGGAL